MTAVAAAHLESLRITLDELPVATAALGGAGTILAANREFQRLFRIAGESAQSLDDVVAEIHRSAVQQALSDLRPSEATAPQRCGLTVMRSKAPCLWVGL